MDQEILNTLMTLVVLPLLVGVSGLVAYFAAVLFTFTVFPTAIVPELAAAPLMSAAFTHRHCKKPELLPPLVAPAAPAAPLPLLNIKSGIL